MRRTPIPPPIPCRFFDPSVASSPPPPGSPGNAFPFTVPIVRELAELDVSAPVTFLVGANGSGKSTLLERIATAAGLPTVGSQDVHLLLRRGAAAPSGI